MAMRAEPYVINHSHDESDLEELEVKAVKVSDR
jgi:hypothetical protein